MPLVIYNKSENILTGTVIMIKKIFKNIKHIKKIFKITNVGYSTVECKLNNTPLLIINIHLNCDRSNKLRLAETNELLKFIKTKKSFNHIIVGGDFNTNSITMHKLYINYGFKSVIEKYQITGTYLCETPMIDYIYVKGFDVKNSKIIHDNKSKMLSLIHI